MLRLERDPAFWSRVASHPALTEAMLGADPEAVGAFAASDVVIPLAAEHGGFLFIRLDRLGRALELHTMFTPEGWGREVLFAAKAAFRLLFSEGAQVIMTHEVEGLWRSRPPKTFRFAPTGEMAPANVNGRPLTLRTWILTRDAFDASPANRRG